LSEMPTEILVPRFVRGLIFDCDGTLADTMGLHWQAWVETFAATGVAVPAALLERTKGLPTSLVMTEFSQQTGRDVDVNAFTQDKEERAREKLVAARSIEPVVAVVRCYRGRLPMAVASSGVRAYIPAVNDAHA
jgi:beta-phosphoglucomutase-like phosphatase (HAD superfamily)